ncbi:MAG: hypothetical protein PWP08_397 [Methanofollis sp.]|nr:hypothetical protein [Methanofollis sp.]
MKALRQIGLNPAIIRKNKIILTTGVAIRMMNESGGFERLKEYLAQNPDLEEVCNTLEISDRDVRGVFRRLEHIDEAEAAEILKRLKRAELSKKE